MELSYDKYERRFWLSLDVPFWLDRLFNPYQDCVEDKEVYVTAIEEALRDMMDLAAAHMISYQFTDPLPVSGVPYTVTRYNDTWFDPAPLPRSNGDTYTMTRYKDFPNLPLPMDQE